MKIINGSYITEHAFTYCSPRYNKSITAKKGEVLDGATGALDICSNGWVIHDIVKKYKKFDDGTECTNLQASLILYDILKSEGRWFRARSWFIATLVWGEFRNLFG